MARRLRYDGVTVELLTDETMTWVEADAIERMTGRTLSRDGDSAAIAGGLVWASIKRARPTLAYSEFIKGALGLVEEFDDEEPEPDPTEPATDAPTPAEPSPSPSSDGPTPTSSTSGTDSAGSTGSTPDSPTSTSSA